MAAMVDCRSLIEFCRAFEHHRLQPTPPRSSSPARSSSSPSSRSRSLNPLAHPFCEHSPLAAIDALILVSVLAAISVLVIPYFRLLLNQFLLLFETLADVITLAPAAYFAGLALTLVTSLAIYELAAHQLRKCGNPYCRGLKKAVEFDIQLESEECVRRLPPAPMSAFTGPAAKRLDLGGDHREELEAELKKMAPLNGRTVLVFRARCGCPAGRMEVWGAKKVRRIKK